MDYTKYSIDELLQVLNSLAFIQECVVFCTSETGRDTASNDYLWSGLIIKENIKAVSEAIRKQTQ